MVTAFQQPVGLPADVLTIRTDLVTIAGAAVVLFVHNLRSRKLQLAVLIAKHLCPDAVCRLLSLFVSSANRAHSLST
jgi:hypothetical protein